MEQRVTKVEARSQVNQLKLTKEREYVDTHFSQMDATLTNLNRRLHIVQEITKNWNKMSQELTTMNTEVVVVRTTQMALQTLLEGISK